MTQAENSQVDPQPRDADIASSEDVAPEDEPRSESDAERAAEYLRLLQRERADFANYRRRTDEERVQVSRDATQGLIQRLLSIVDDFERATANASPEELSSTWGQGVALVERNLRSLLASYQVQPFDAHGAAFDPYHHEAISYQPSPDMTEGHVMHVVRTGYKQADRVIRPAQVVVAAGPAA